jgi:CHAD domain-containing protein
MGLEPRKAGKAAQRLRKFLKKHSGHVTPKQIHRLRTTIRRLEAAADAALPKPSYGEGAALQDIGRIRKRAGKIRDMDVLTADAISMRVPENQQEQLVELVHHLGAQRHKQARRLRSLVRGEGRGISKEVKRLSAHLRRRMSSSKAGNDAPGTQEVIAAAVQLAAGLKRPPTLNSRNLHGYRLKVKKLRDVIRLANGPVQTGLVEALAEVKDAIGDWHDWEELASIASEILDGRSRALAQHN